MTMSKRFRGFATALLVLGSSACGGHHLADYDFHGRTIAVVPLGAPAPEIWTGDHTIGSDNPLVAVIEAGSAVAVHLEGRRARARLDSAATHVDMEQRIARQALDRSARYLGTRRIDDVNAADYVLEIDVQRFGINASGGSSATLFVQGEAVLIDGRTGREIWNQEVDAWDQLTPTISGPGSSAAGGVLTAAALTSITVADYERILMQLADYTADVMTDELREDLRDVRDD